MAVQISHKELLCTENSIVYSAHLNFQVSMSNTIFLPCHNLPWKLLYRSSLNKNDVVERKYHFLLQCQVNRNALSFHWELHLYLLINS